MDEPRLSDIRVESCPFLQEGEWFVMSPSGLYIPVEREESAMTNAPEPVDGTHNIAIYERYGMGLFNGHVVFDHTNPIETVTERHATYNRNSFEL